jgi:hypothetical protein
MSQSDEEQFELNGKDAHAIGVLTENGFVVREGAVARKEIVPSAADTVAPMRKRLISDGVLIEDGNGLRFAKDHRFDSPSGAAAVVLGRTANGWIEWKRPDGQTLSKVKRVSRDGQEPLLDEAKRKQIIERHQQLMNEGKLPSQQQLDKEYGLFRERFGPQVLAGLDGEPLLKYSPQFNPQRRQPPTPRPDYVVTQQGAIRSILDAKYRDLWEKHLPREMLYQLVVYAISHRKRPQSSILYPTMDIRAKEARIDVTDPLFGKPLGQVCLRPVLLPRIERLIGERTSQAQRERGEYAHRLAFGA